MRVANFKQLATQGKMDITYTTMIVDDSSEDRFLLKRYMKKTTLPLIVLECENGQEALELLMTPDDELQSLYPGISAPITLFLDINMPIMNGWEFVEELVRRRDDVILNPTVVLMYSTSDNDTDKQKAEEYTAVSNYIVKGESTPDSIKNAILQNYNTHHRQHPSI